MARSTRGGSRRGGKKGGGSSRQSIRDKARQAAEQREKGGGLDTLKDLPRDTEFFKPKMGKGVKGKNHISIVPYIVSIGNHPFQAEGEPWHECTYWRHKVGTGSDSKSFICLAKTPQAEDKRCPICDYRSALLKSGEDPDLAEELKPKQRQLFNVLDHNNEDKGIMLFDISPHNFGFMLEEEDAAQEEDFPDRFYGDFENGLSIAVRFSAESFGGGKFPDCSRIDFEERDDLPEEMVTEDAVDLDAVLRILSYDELHAKFFEIEEEPDGEEEEQEEEEEEEKPSSRSSRRGGRSSGKRNRRQQEEEEEEEPEEEEEEGEEEEEEGDENPCPFGHIFGTDNDKYEKDCDQCEEWDDCRDELDRLEEEERKKKPSGKGGRRRR